MDNKQEKSGLSRREFIKAAGVTAAGVMAKLLSDNPDTGTQNQTPFWNGRSYVQLTSAAAGSVYLGREYTPAFWVQLKSDPFGNDGVGQTGVGINWAGYMTPDAASGVTTVPQAAWPGGGSARSSNTIGYKTPNMGGFTANVAVSLAETTGQGRGVGFNAEYAAGPIYAGLGYEKINDGTADGNGVLNLAFHYNLGFIKPMIYFAKSDVGTLSNKVVLLSASAPLGNGLVKFGVSRVTLDLPAAAAEDTHTKVGLGYNYNLSKRTNLYFDLGSATGVANITGVKGERSTAYAVGVRHTF